MFDTLKDLISDAINDLDSDDFMGDVELQVELNEEKAKVMFERLVNVAVDAIQKETDAHR